jgi:hypothetical protein
VAIEPNDVPSAVTTTRPIQSRRAVLGAALGATAAAAAGVLARPAPVAATVTPLSSGQENAADAPTGLVVTDAGKVALYVSTASIPGVVTGGVVRVSSGNGHTAISVDVSGSGWGMDMNVTGTDAIGIALSATGTNAKGMQVDGGSIGIDVSAQTTGGIGLNASAFGLGSIGVDGYGAIGVLGESQSGSGIGVKGTAGSGTAGLFTATTGTALQTTGKVKLNRSGKATIGAGKSYVDVAVAGGLAGTPLCFANLRTNRTGVYVQSVIPTTSTGKIRIRLNKVASSSSSTYVSWAVLG